MKFCPFIFLFLIFRIESKKINFLPLIISQVVEELFIKPGVQFDIFIINIKDLKVTDSVKEFLKVMKNFSSVEILHTKKFKNLNRSALIFMEDFEALQNFNKKVKLMNFFPTKLKFLIYCQKLLIKDIQNISIDILNLMNRGHISQYEYFITETKKEIKLTTIEWFTKVACDRAQIKILGNFNKKLKKWKSFEIQEKFQNFHKCMIIEQRQMDEINKLNGKPIGIITDYFKIVAQVGNFTPNFQYVNGTIFSNTKNFPIPKNGKTLMIHTKLVRISISLMAFGSFHSTSAIDDIRMIFITTPGEDYSSIEMIFLPFDYETWTFLGSYFGIAFIVIFIVNHMSKSIKNLIYGVGIHSAAFNVIAVSLGVTVYKVPKNNFARIILTFFIFYCLIIRTAYQGW